MEPSESAASRPQLAPRGASVHAAPAEKKPVVGVVVVRNDYPSTEEISKAAESGGCVVFSVQKGGEATPPMTPSLGVHVVESALGSGPGRMRNAGYRVLKKELPDIEFVQFLDDGFLLHPGWLDVASKFLQRRPEVAVAAGGAGSQDARPLRDGGEVRIVGRSFLIRAEAFEAAGGFRGDLLVNESADLCVRLRRRGAHLWMLADPMTTAGPASPKSWWARARDDGYAFAHGARLHGAPPERLFVREHISGVAWGAVAPALVLMTSAGLGALFLLRGSPLAALVASAAALFFGVLLYVARIAAVGFGRGGDGASWRYALQDTAGQFAEFLGACRFYLSGVDPRRNAS
ncbi:MAG: hypothetical protein K2Q06_11580 [Parvularculaceae bacterium]|nr:hypothetical protein [Parvularculaceae bacterium]